MIGCFSSCEYSDNCGIPYPVRLDKDFDTWFNKRRNHWKKIKKCRKIKGFRRIGILRMPILRWLNSNIGCIEMPC